MYLIKLNNLFLTSDKRIALSEEHTNAHIFKSYDDVCDAIEALDLCSYKGSAEVFSDYGTDNESVEDI